jgi:hypothetical protein
LIGESCWQTLLFSCKQYGQTAAALYAKSARQLYNVSADTYYKANEAAACDDWVRARKKGEYFYNCS